MTALLAGDDRRWLHALSFVRADTIGEDLAISRIVVPDSNAEERIDDHVTGAR